MADTARVNTPSSTQLIARSGGLLLGEMKSALFMFWIGPASVADLQLVHRRSLELLREHPGGLVHVSLLSRTIPIAGLSNDAHAALLKALRDPNMKLLCNAVVLHGDGFRAALVRSALSGALLLSRTSHAATCVASVQEADTWLTGPMGSVTQLRSGSIIAAVKELSATLGPRANEF